MSMLFDDLQEGLIQAVDYAANNGPAKVTTYKIEPVTKLDKEQIRAIRLKARMTQRVFADYLGVSVKTVEAWERGRTHPTGPAYRLMSLLDENPELTLPFMAIS